MLLRMYAVSLRLLSKKKDHSWIIMGVDLLDTLSFDPENVVTRVAIRNM